MSIALKRILILTKYRFIGDTLLAVPLIRAAKTAWPDAQITLLTGAPACELLRGCPYVDSTIEFDPYRKQDQGWGRFLETVKQIHKGRFDLALVCNRSFHSALLAFLGSARERVGWSGFQGRDWMLTKTVAYGVDSPEQACYLDLMRPLTDSPHSDDRLELWVTDDERSGIAGKVPQGASPLIAFQPGASHAEKQWSSEKYAELAGRLGAKYPGCHFVLIGGPDESEVAGLLLSRLPAEHAERTHDFVGALNLRQTLALLTYCGLFVGGDTAIRHAASALGVPSVALFGPTSVAKWGNARPPLHLALRSETGKVEDISVDDVFIASSGAIDSKNSVENVAMA